MSKVSKLFFFLFILINPSKSTDEQPSGDIRYRSVTLDLDYKSVPTETVVVVRNRDEYNVPASFTKYVLYGVDKEGYFNAASVVFGDERIIVNGSELSVNYIYDVYTYWKDGQILVAAFRYYYGGTSSYYKYFRRADKIWNEVQESEFGANSYGFITTESLTKLLKIVEKENPKQEVPEENKPDKKETQKFTVIIVSVVVIALLVLLLVGLAFYFFK